MKMKTCISLLLLLLLGAALEARAKSLVLAGGGISDDNAAVYGAIVELAGGVGVARIGIVVAASGDPADSASFYTDLFVRVYGAREAVVIPIDLGQVHNNEDPAVVALIQGLGGFFFGGGDQARVIEAFFHNQGGVRVESSALRAIKEAHDAGAVVAGSSAGTACQGSAVMINGGRSYEAVVYGAYSSAQSNADKLVYDSEGGLGTIHGVVVDSHFSERGREGRLARLLWDTRDKPHGAARGIGVDEDTALVITAMDTEPRAKVVGKFGVLFMDLSGAWDDTASASWHLRNVRVHYLTEDDSLDMLSWRVTFAPWKSATGGREDYDYAVTSADVFGARQFARVATNLFNSRYSKEATGSTKEKKPQYEVRMSKELGAGAKGRSPVDGYFMVSYRDLLLEMYEAVN
ncbi:cyanophycinase-like [Lethenteron reissneri]|uniref:cyanophycinase-like n=1 Tax=Lethenteron reissneri TaxID=7753 RepID=UPI002AB76569|nr:cyanophycinase-like [Lethenteron reissneri]